MARRSPGVGGSVGGVLPLLTVGGSFVRRTRPVYSKRIPWARQRFPFAKQCDEQVDLLAAEVLAYSAATTVGSRSSIRGGRQPFCRAAALAVTSPRTTASARSACLPAQIDLGGRHRVAWTAAKLRVSQSAIVVIT